MTTSWILVANSSKAYIYACPKAKLISGDAKLQLISEHVHPESRLKERQMTSDQVGHYHKKGGSYGDFVEETDLKEYEFERFAKEMVEVLEEGRNNNAYQELIMIAPQRFHGMLNKNLTDNLRALVIINIQHDYVHLNPSQLVKQLAEYL